MQPKSTLAVLLPAAFLFHSCASILNSKEQKMTLITDHEDNKVYVNDSLIGTGTTVLTKFKRDLTAKEVRIEREGQEDKTYAVIQTKKSPLYFFSVVPFGITFYAPFMDSHPKAFDYDKNQPVFTPGEEYVKQKEENKHIFINEAKINIGKGDFTIKGIPYKNYKKRGSDSGSFWSDEHQYPGNDGGRRRNPGYSQRDPQRARVHGYNGNHPEAQNQHAVHRRGAHEIP